MLSFILRKYRKYFNRNNSIRFGAEVKNTQLANNINISRYSFISGSKIDDYTSIGRNSTIINSQLGKFCSISWNVTIGATKHDYSRLTTHAFPYIKNYGFVEKDSRFVVNTVIGNDVWIGANCVIMPGVKIGDGAVIGAGSVVTKDVGNFEIVYGVPARTRGFRFDDQTILEIQKMKWWDWEDKTIKKRIEIFKNPFGQTKDQRPFKE